MPGADVHADADAKWWRWLNPGVPWYALEAASPATDLHDDLWSGAVRCLDGDDSWMGWWTQHAPRANCALHPYFQDAADRQADGPADLARHDLFAERVRIEHTADETRIHIRYDVDWTKTIEHRLELLVRQQVLEALAGAGAQLRMPEPPEPSWRTDDVAEPGTQAS